MYQEIVNKISKLSGNIIRNLMSTSTIMGFLDLFLELPAGNDFLFQ